MRVAAKFGGKLGTAKSDYVLLYRYVFNDQESLVLTCSEIDFSCCDKLNSTLPKLAYDVIVSQAFLLFLNIIQLNLFF